MIQVKDNVVPEKYSYLFEKVLGADIAYYRAPATYGRIVYLSHTLLKRDAFLKTTFNLKEPMMNSYYYPPFAELATFIITEKFKLPFEEFFRMSINWAIPDGEFIQTDPHCDHFFKHKNLLIYLTDSSGETLIYDKKASLVEEPGWDKDSHIADEPIETFKGKIKTKITPKKGRAVIFDGAHYHANVLPKPGDQRILLVATFS